MATLAAPKTRRELRTELRNHLKTSAVDHLNNYLSNGQNGSLHAALETSTGYPDGGQSQAAPPPAPPSFEHPMMTVEQFLAGHYVEPGDVVLMTKLGSFFAWLIRNFNGSDFAHAAMVFQTPEHMDGLEQTFLIETS